MANNSEPRNSIQTIILMIGIIAIFVIVIVFAFAFSLPNSISVSTAVQPTSVSTRQYQPEVIPPLTSEQNPTKTATVVLTNTPASTQTPIVIPSLVFNRQLPDLTVSAVSDPFCRPDYPGTILEFTIFVRNIGRAGTRTFGSFDTAVYLILGQRRYSLDEWAEQFEGVVGSSVTEVFNLNPNDDIKFTVVIDLIGNKSFGIEVVANSGESPIPEADRTNNTLIKYFSVYCF